MYKKIFGTQYSSSIDISPSKDIWNIIEEYIYENHIVLYKKYFRGIKMHAIVNVENPFEYCLNNSYIHKLYVIANFIRNITDPKDNCIKECGLSIYDNILNIISEYPTVSLSELIKVSESEKEKKKEEKEGEELLYVMFLSTNVPKKKHNIIKVLFENEDYSSRNKRFENMFFRKYICPFYYFWDCISIWNKYKLRKMINIDKNNFLKYYFFKICDDKIFSDVGDKSFVILGKEKLCDVNLVFKQ